MAFQIGAHGAGPLANAGRLGSQLWIGNHFLDVAEAIGPVAETIAGERAGALWVVLVKRAEAAPEIAIGQALTALPLTALAWLAWLLPVLWLSRLCSLR
jgi:hypothetical protein